MNSSLKISAWSIQAEDLDQNDQSFYESVMAQGNGYMGVRGFDPLGEKQNEHERSVFLAGFFEYIKTGITDMVNTPDPFSVRLGLPGQRQSADVSLDLRTGLLTWKSLWQMTDGSRFSVVSRRVVSMDEKHVVAMEIELTPLDGEMDVDLEVGLDGDVANLPISDDQLRENTHVQRLLAPVICKADQQGGLLVMESLPSRHRIYQGYRVASNMEVTRQAITKGSYTAVRFTGRIPAGEVLRIEKIVATYLDRDKKLNPVAQATALAAELGAAGFDHVFRKSAEAWMQLWDECDIELDTDDKELQGAVRYNVFQLLQNNASDDPRASIGARGLMHGRYKGNYFWDTEIFMLPFYLYTRPRAAKNLLMYRYHTLPDARRMATSFGLRGARYSWMCSNTGNEQCETWDTGCCEVHITADIAHAVQQYVHVTGDEDFLVNYGAEILLETARYWVSRLTYYEAEDCYNMLFVKGPDEYCGVTNNNSYTNFLVRENLLNAVQAVAIVRKHPGAWSHLREKLAISDEELEQFTEVAGKIRILYDEKRALLLQDETFEKLEPLDIAAHKEGASALYRTMSYDRLQRYKVVKQADLVLLMTMFPDRFTVEQQRNVWAYYEPLTLHDSSLSFGTHAQLAATLEYKEVTLDYFHKSVFLDLRNIMDNTHREGIHMAAFGASWQALVLGMAGLTITREGQPELQPRLPSTISGMNFPITVRGRKYRVMISRGKASIEEL